MNLIDNTSLQMCGIVPQNTMINVGCLLTPCLLLIYKAGVFFFSSHIFILDITLKQTEVTVIFGD